MEAWTNVGVPLIVALLTSTALWGVVSKVILKRMELTAKRSKADEAQRKMLVGLAHDRIIHLGMVYIERGYVTQDEYENLQVYLSSRMRRWAATAAHGASWRKCGSCPFGEAKSGTGADAPERNLL